MTFCQISFRKYFNVSCKLCPPRRTARIDYRRIWPIRLELAIILMFILSYKFYYLVVHMDISRLYRARKMLKFLGLFYILISMRSQENCLIVKLVNWLSRYLKTLTDYQFCIRQRCSILIKRSLIENTLLYSSNYD